jgi:prophage regulatory protein
MSISKFATNSMEEVLAQLLAGLQPANESAISRLPEVLGARGRSRSSHYHDIKEGLFTAPVSIGARAVGWPAREVALLNAARIAGKSDEEIRALVVRLQAFRKLLHGRQP